MSKPYTADDFSRLITTDRTWRMKEISDLKTAIRAADNNLSNALLRALIALAYAHWESHVRYCAMQYMRHVALRKLQLRFLSPQFLRNLFLPRLAAFWQNKANVHAGNAFIEDLLSGGDKRFSHVNHDLIDTKSNLNSETLREICLVCDVDYGLFEMEESFIDIILLKRRNSVAHGEEFFIGREDLDMLADKTIQLMRAFSDDLENKAHLCLYKAA